MRAQTSATIMLMRDVCLLRAMRAKSACAQQRARNQRVTQDAPRRVPPRAKQAIQTAQRKDMRAARGMQKVRNRARGAKREARSAR